MSVKTEKTMDESSLLHDSLFLKACRREPVERTPIWLMRQAGRYMKEYRDIRAKVSFLELCKNPDLAAQVTVDAADKLGVDAAIIFSDILVVLEPMGLALSYEKNDGPVIANPVKTKGDVESLREFDPEKSLAYVYEAVQTTRKNLKKGLPLLGFAGAPFTLASYAIEGKSSRQFTETKSFMRLQPALWKTFLNKIADAVIVHLNAQIAAGCQAVQLFDSWAGALSPADYREFVFPFTKKVVEGIKPGVPVINFGTNTGGFLDALKETGGAVIGLDWRVDLKEAWDRLGDVAVMGNLDPAILLTSPEEIRKEARKILDQAGGRPGHIFNLGHGILPQTPVDNVLALVSYVKEASSR